MCVSSEYSIRDKRNKQERGLHQDAGFLRVFPLELQPVIERWPRHRLPRLFIKGSRGGDRGRRVTSCNPPRPTVQHHSPMRRGVNQTFGTRRVG